MECPAEHVYLTHLPAELGCRLVCLPDGFRSVQLTLVCQFEVKSRTRYVYCSSSYDSHALYCRSCTCYSTVSSHRSSTGPRYFVCLFFSRALTLTRSAGGTFEDGPSESGRSPNRASCIDSLRVGTIIGPQQGRSSPW